MKLWCPEGTDFVALASNSFSGSLKSLASSSWFTVKVSQENQTSTQLETLTNLPRTCCPSLPYLWQKITEDEQQRIEKGEEKPKQQKQSKTKKELTEEEKEKKLLQLEEKKKLRMEENQRKKEDEKKELEMIRSNKKKKRVLKQPSSSTKPKVVKPKKPKAERTTRVLLNLTTQQKATLNRWFGTARWTYNQCVALWKDKQYTSLEMYRNRVVYNDVFENTDKAWVLGTPQYIRDEAMKDFATGLHTNLKKGEPFEMKFRSKKRKKTESMVIHSKNWKNGVIYPSFFGKTPIKGSLAKRRLKRNGNPLPANLGYDCRLIRTRTMRYYLLVLKPLETKGDNQAPEFQADYHSSVVSIDPGVRTFLTCYDPSGNIIEWGIGDMNRLFRLGRHIDRLISKRENVDGPKRNVKRRRMKLAEHRLRERMRNLVDECQRKAAKYLTTNYRVILIPSFGVSAMIKRATRKIGKKTVRQMLNWGHYRFRMRLLDKAREYPWCKVIVCTEEYTSKTCGKCGHSYQVKSDEVYNCRNVYCRMSMDRDWNGARNILLKYITERQLVL